MLSDLQNLPSRGFLPAEGMVGICSKLPAYIAAHNTAPAQIILTDLTSPLVRSLHKQKIEQQNEKAAAKHGGSGSRKRKSAAPASKQPKGREAKKPCKRSSGAATAAAPCRAHETGGAHGPSRTYHPAELAKLQKKELMDILRAYGATVTGKKEELVARVQDMQRRRHDTVIELSDGSDDGGGDPALVTEAAAPPAPPMTTPGETDRDSENGADDEKCMEDEAEEFEQEHI